MDLKKIFEELAIWEEKKGDKLNKKYHTSEQFKARLDKVIGRENYSKEFSPLRFETLPTGQVLSICECTIYIYDDEGRAVRMFTASGDKAMETSKDNPNFYINIGNIAEFTQAKAFCNCCKAMHVFEDELCSSKENKPKQSEETLSDLFITKGTLKAFDFKDDTAYKIPVSRAKDGMSGDLVFYPNQLDDAWKKKIDNLAAAAASQEVKFETRYIIGRNGGFIFKK